MFKIIDLQLSQPWYYPYTLLHKGKDQNIIETLSNVKHNWTLNIDRCFPFPSEMFAQYFLYTEPHFSYF